MLAWEQAGGTALRAQKQTCAYKVLSGDAPHLYTQRLANFFCKGPGSRPY